MINDDDLDARVERLRTRQAARKKHQDQPAALAMPEGGPSAFDDFAVKFATTKTERAWIQDHLGPLRERELIGDVLRRVQAGKEATVYACSGGSGSDGQLLAAKLYRPTSLRGERNVAHYQQGRDVLDASGRPILPRGWRLQKAIAQKSRAGRQAAQSSWLMHEFSVLSALSALGADVPRPVEHGEFVLLMEFIGEGLEPAPTLSQITLSSSEARPLLERIVFNLELLLGLGWVHGDLSAHNLLYQAGRALMIDFPQVVAIEGNPAAYTLLERDVQRLSQYFGRAGVGIDPQHLSRQLWSKYGASGVQP